MFRANLHRWNLMRLSWVLRGNKAQPSNVDPSVRLPSTSQLCGVEKYGIETRLRDRLLSNDG